MAKSNRGLRSIPQYIKNVSRSAMYAGGDVFQEIMPSTTSFVSSNSEIFKSISNDVRNLKSITKKVSSKLSDSETLKTGKTYIKNLKEDLATGNFVNKSRDNDYMLQASGFGDLFDDSMFDFSDDGLDSEPISKGDAATINAIESTTSAIIENNSASSMAIANTNIKSAEMVAKNQQNIYAMQTVNSYKMFNEINSVMNDMATNIRGIFQHTSVSTEYYNSSMKMNEDTLNSLNEIKAFNKEYVEMQRSLYAEFNKKSAPNISGDKIDDLFTGGGGLDIGTYINRVRENINKAWSSSLLGSSMGMLGEGSNPLLAFASSPLSFIAKGMVKGLITDDLKKSMVNFDETFSGFFKSGLLKMSSMLKQKSETNPIFETIYKIFGIDLSSSTGLNTGKFVKGPVPLDGLMRQSIIEVIPGYLRVIASALTGTEQKVYNYEKGKFENMSHVKKALESTIDLSYSNINSSKNTVSSIINDTYSFDKNNKEIIDKDLTRFFRFLVDKGVFFNPKNDDYEKMNDMGLLLSSENSFNLIKETIKALGPNEWQSLNDNILSNIDYSKRYYEDVNKRLAESGISAAINGLNKEDKIESKVGLHSVDKFNNSVFTYLKDIRTILLEGIKVFIENDDPSSPSSTLLNRENRYNDKDISTKPKNKTTTTTFKDPKKKHIESLITMDGVNITGDIQRTILRKNEEDNSSKDNSDNKKEKTVTSVFSKLKESAKGIIGIPLNSIKSIMDSVNESLITFLYGKDGNSSKKGLLESLSDKFIGLGTKISDYINTKIVDPINAFLFDADNGIVTKMKKSFSDIKDKITGTYSDGKYSDGWVSPIINGVLDTKDSLINLVSGKSYVSRLSGKQVEKRDKTIFGEIKSMFSGAKDLITGNNKDGKNNSFVTKIHASINSSVAKLSKRLFGTEDLNMTPAEFYNKHISKRMANIGAGSIMGLALPMFTPLGLLGGMFTGAGIGLLSTSDRFKNKMFGENYEGGIIPKSFIDTVKNGAPSLFKGLGTGALLGLVTPFGLVGSALLGGGIGFASSTESVKNLLFGKMGEDGERDDSNALIKQAWVKKFKDSKMKNAILNGAKIGIVGSLFLPGGLIGGALLGMAGGIASQGNAVKTFLFGNINPETDAREGGLFGKLKVWFKTDVVAPFGTFVEDIKSKGLFWLRKNILNPLAESIDPIKKQMGIWKDNFIENIKAGFEATKTFVGGMFENVVGKPFSTMIKDSFIDPLKKLFNNTFGKLGKALSNVIKAPFTLIHKTAMGYMAQHKKDGVADYEEEWLKKKEKRDKKTYDDYNSVQSKVKQDRQRQKIVERLLKAGKYDPTHPATIKAMQMLNINASKSAVNKGISVDESIDRNTKNMSDVLNDIKDWLFNNGKKSSNGTDDKNNKKPVIDTDDKNIVFDKDNIIKENPEFIDTDNTNNKTIKSIFGKFKIYMRQLNTEKNHVKVHQNNREVETKQSNKKDKSKDNDDVDPLPKTNFGRSNNSNKVSLFNKTNNQYLKSIQESTRGIFIEVKDQLLNVGYNIEYIANILSDQFGSPSKLPNGERKGVMHGIKRKFTNFFERTTAKIKDYIESPFIALKRTVLDPIINVGSAFVKGIIGIPNFVGKMVGSAASSIFKTLNVVTKGIVGTALQIGDVLAEVTKSVVKSIPSIIDLFASSLKQVVKVAGETFTTFIKTAGTVINHTVDVIGKTTVALVDISTKAIPVLFNSIMTLTGNIMKSVPKVVGGLFSIGKTILGKGFKLFGNNVKFNTSPFGTINTIEFVHNIGNVQKVNEIESINSINDDRLYSGFDSVVSAINSVIYNTNDINMTLKNTNAKENNDSNISLNNSNKENNTNTSLKNNNNKENNTRINVNNMTKMNNDGNTPIILPSGDSSLLLSQPKQDLLDLSKKDNDGNTPIILPSGDQSSILPPHKQDLLDLSKKDNNPMKNVIDSITGEYNTTKDGLFNKSPLLEQNKYNGYRNDISVKKFIAKEQGEIDEKENQLMMASITSMADSQRGILEYLKGSKGSSLWDLLKSLGSSLISGLGNLFTKKGLFTSLSVLSSGLMAIYAKRKISEKVSNSLDYAKENLVDENGNVTLSGVSNTALGIISGEADYMHDTSEKASDKNTAHPRAVQYMLKSKNKFVARARENIFSKSKGIAQAVKSSTTHGLNIINKIFESKAMKKLMGNKLGQVSGKIAKWIVANLSKMLTGSRLIKFVSKVSAKWAAIIGSGTVSAGVIPAVWFGGTLLNGVSATNRMFEVSSDFKPTNMMRTIAGLTSLIDGYITFGLISTSTIAQFIGSLVLSEDDNARIKSGRSALNLNYQTYVNENGSDMSFNQYNEQVENASLITKGLQGIKKGANSIFRAFDWIKMPNLFKGVSDLYNNVKDKSLDLLDTANATIGAIFNLYDDNGNPINFTEWAKIKTTKFIDHLSYIGKSVIDKASYLWDTTVDWFKDIPSKISKGFEYTDNLLGSLLGIKDDEGNPVSLSTGVKNSYNAIKDSISSVTSRIADTASKMWTALGEGLDKLGESISTGLDKANDWIGNVLGLKDKDGNSISLTESIGNTVSSVKNWVSNKWSNFKQKVKVRKRYSSKTNGGYGGVSPEDCTDNRCNIKVGGYGSNNNAPTSSSGDSLNGAVYYSQSDNRWGSNVYLANDPLGDMTAAGCGPTSAAMVIASTADSSVTPWDVAQYSISRGYAIDGVGTSWGLYPDLGAKYGIGLNQTTDFDAAASALRAGQPVIFSGSGDAPFTKYGHFVVGVGMDGSRILVNDPVNRERSTYYDYSAFKNKAAAAWISTKAIANGTSTTSVANGSVSSNSGQNTEDEDITGLASFFTGLTSATAGLASSLRSGTVFDESMLNGESYNTKTAIGSTSSSGSGWVGNITDYDFDFNSIPSIGKSEIGNKVYSYDNAGRSLGISNDGFIELIAPAAIKAMEDYNIPASTTMAQAILESGWGRHAIGNNLMGVKEGSGYNGPVVSTSTLEQNSNGSAYSITANFRGYNGINEGLYDYAENVIVGNPQYYSGVRTSDYRASLNGLQSYATDVNYIPKLLSTIHANDLTKYNSMSSKDLGGKGGFGERGETQQTNSVFNKPKSVLPTPVIKQKPQENINNEVGMQRMVADSLKYNNDYINDAIIASTIVQNNTMSIPYAEILAVLNEISINTSNTANNTERLLEKETNVTVINENKINEDVVDDESNKNDTLSPNKNGFLQLVNKGKSVDIDRAYSKASKYAFGVRQ